MKPFHGHRVVGYWEPPVSRAAVVAVKTMTGYALYILWLDAERNVDDKSEVISRFTDIRTRDDLLRQFLNLILIIQ